MLNQRSQTQRICIVCFIKLKNENKNNQIIILWEKKLVEWLPFRGEGVIGRPSLTLQVEILECVHSQAIVLFLDLDRITRMLIS